MAQHIPRARGIRALITTLVTFALALVGVVVTAPAAQAATFGPGWNYNAESHLGAYRVNGINGYCLTPGIPWPSGTSTDDGIATSFTSHGPTAGANPHVLDATTLGKLNFLITKYGQTTNKNRAAAVAMTVSRIANPAAYDEHTAPYGDNYYMNYMPDADWVIVKSLVARYRAEAAAYTPAGTGSAAMKLAIDTNNYKGTLTITALSPSPATGTITLKNGTFADGKTTKTGTFTAGQSLPIIGVPPAGETHYEVSAHASFTGAGGPGGNIRLWTTPGVQTLGTPGTSTPVTFTADAKDTYERSTLFAPVLSTKVTSVFVQAGETPKDEVTFATTNFTDPVSTQTVNNPWHQGPGGYDIVTATGTWYGPSTTPLTQSATIPDNIPVAGRATITTTASQGPTVSYTAESDTPAGEAGYYTWVWSITGTKQPTGTQAQLPPGYEFTDDFGQASESQVSPSKVTFSTQLSKATAVIGDTVTDTITPSLTGGGWLQADGKRIPVTLTGDAYYSATKPVQAATPPAGATKVGTFTQVLGGPSPVVSAPIPVGYKAGFVTIQWSIRTEAQPAEYRGFFAEWADDYGVPSETVQVLAPSITTTAQTVTAPGGTVQDTATVTGPIPTAGLDLSWRGYLRPAGAGPTCTADTLVFTSSTVVTITKAGAYPSEAFTVPSDLLGKIDWIETATLHGSTQVIATGQCGAKNETSISALPTVTTIPPTGATAGSTVHDELTVDGWINAGMTVIIRLYKQTPDAKTLVCDASTLVGDPLGPIAIAPGRADHARYLSPETGKLNAGHYGFVEQLLDNTGKVIDEGGCHEELFTVAAPAPKPPASSLAQTGADPIPAGIATGLLLTAGGILLLVRRAIRPRHDQAEPTDGATTATE